MKSLRAYISGDPFGVPPLLDSPILMRPAQRTYSSLAFMRPIEGFWNDDEVCNNVGIFSACNTNQLFQQLFITKKMTIYMFMLDNCVVYASLIGGSLFAHSKPWFPW